MQGPPLTHAGGLPGFADELANRPPGAANDVGEVTVIAPEPGWRAINVASLWRQRELLYFLIWRDVKVRYKQTVIGAAWSVLQPLATMVLFTVIFGRLANISFEGLPFPLAVYAGLLPWMFFSSAVSQAGLSLVNQAHLLTKIYFPRLFVPTACIGASLVDFAIGFSVYAGMMVWYWHPPGSNILYLPLLLSLVLITAAGVGLSLASLIVVYRDFRFVVPFMMQLGMFLSAAPFPSDLWPQRYHLALSVNPMFGIIKGFRASLLNQPLDWASLGISSLSALVLFVFGLYYFRRVERRFADIA